MHHNALEIWKDVRGFEGDYQVSNLGRVRAMPAFGSKPREIRGYISEGYRYVSFYRHGIKKSVLLGRVVLEAFAPRPDEADFVAVQLNGDRDDNTLGNLTWMNRGAALTLAYSRKRAAGPAAYKAAS